MGMNMATIATEAVCGVVEAETAASLVALSGNLCSDKARRHQRRRGARPERHRRRSDPARGRRRTPAHHARSGRGTQHARTWSAPRRPRASGSTPTSPTSSPRCSSPPGGTGAGRRGRERHHDRRGAGRRPLRLGLHRLPRSRHRRRRHETPDAVRGARYPRRQRRRRPRRLQRRRPRQMHRRRFPRGRTLPSLRARLAAPLSAPPPNSVGNCMGVVVRPRFIGSEFVDPTLIMNVLSRGDTTRLRDTRIQRISRTYYQRLVQSRTCLREVAVQSPAQ